MRRIAPLLLALLLAPAVRGDTVVLTNGKRLEDVVVSRHDGGGVVINPFNSRHPDMTWEIPDKNRIPADRVREVIIADAPRAEYRRRASAPGLTAGQHLELAAFCDQHKLREERHHELERALCLEPDNEEALRLFGASKAKAWMRGNPEADPELARLERSWLALEDEDELEEAWTQMRALGTSRSLTYLERARRSARLPKGRRDAVALTLRSRESPGANYCIHVSSTYDPLVPTGLVVGLHGGGPGGKDRTLVTGSGESAMNFYEQEAEEWGWIVVCPTALAAPWSARANETMLDAVLDEVRTLYNVDENRIYLTGHSMGGFGAWYWGPKRADVWAACAPCAGGGGPNGIDAKGIPVYIYHGSDDGVVGPDWDRSAARSLLSKGKKVDFVYTELDGVGHGFPSWVRTDIFRWFAGRRKDRGRKTAVAPASSFEAKVDKEEVRAFGDPTKIAGPGEEDDATLRDLLKALEGGGGGAAAAADELEKRKDDATARAVARLLKSTKSSVDTKVQAARVLGAIGLPVCVKPLLRAASDKDFRVVEAAAGALGRTGLPEAAEPLARVGRRLGDLYRESFFGKGIMFNEYEVRLGSFVTLVDALAALGDAATALPVLADDVVGPVFAPREPYQVLGEQDGRFRNVPPAARLRLAQSLRACLVRLKDPRGIDLLRQIEERWPGEERLVHEARQGIADLQGEGG